MGIIKNINEVDFRDKKVLLRVDFNVLVKAGKVIDGFRIEKTLPTIRFLKKSGAKIIIISHIVSGGNNDLGPVVKYLNKYIKAELAPGILDLKTKRKISEMKSGDVIVLKNIRSDKREEKNDKKFAKKLAEPGDIFVNDAFSASHRNHASIIGIPKYLPSYVGLLFEKELKNLQNCFNASHPFLLILGGVKFGTKLGVLKKFIKTADNIFIGGALANNFFKLRGIDIGNSLFDGGVNVKKYLNNKKIILPIDVRKKNNVILDAGPNTIKMLSGVIKKSKCILWNGPLGDFEKRGFEKGTIEIAKAIAKSGARSIIGGGDTVAILDKYGLLNKFDFVSTGGGAMLEFLAKGTLPGIEALKKSKSKSKF